jgi:HAE1 family hydrophobic/amphiphilic exporter-1
MASAVATPLEKQFSTIAGLDSMTSTSSLGSTQITLQFDLDRTSTRRRRTCRRRSPRPRSRSCRRDADAADVPQGQPGRPADLFLALTSRPRCRCRTVDEYAETLLAQRISMVSGVAQVQVYGAQKYAVRIQVDPNKRARGRQIGIDEVATAIKGGNVNLPTGTLYGPTRRSRCRPTAS